MDLTELFKQILHDLDNEIFEELKKECQNGKTNKTNS